MNRRFGILGAIAAATVFLLSAGPAVSGDEKGTAHKKEPLAAVGLDGASAMSDSELGEVSGDTANSDKQTNVVNGLRHTHRTGRPVSAEFGGVSVTLGANTTKIVVPSQPVWY